MKHKSYEALVICLAVLLAVPMVQGVNITQPCGGINPYLCDGTNNTVYCGVCSVNESCPTCDPCNTPGTCSIDVNIQPGEKYENEEGTCDIDIYCDYEETAKNVEKNYTFRMKLNKHDGDDIYLGIEVVDFLNTITDSETYDWSRDSIVAITEEFDFTCPTKVIFDSVNADTCAGYFEDYYTDKDPMSMMLAKDMAIYRDRFLACQDNKSEIVWQIAHYEGLYRTCDNLKQNAITDMKTMNDTVITMRRSITGEVTSKTQGELYTMTLMAAIGWGCLILLALAYMYGGKGG